MNFPALLRTTHFWMIGFSLALATGCSSTGNSVNPFAQDHKMIESAKELRYTGVAALPRELNKQPLEAYVVEPGDGLLILPAEIDSTIRVPSDQTVLPDGTLDLGRYGRPQVSGRTLPDIEKIVNQTVKAQSNAPEPGKSNLLTVRLVNRVSKVYYVLGEVNTPGAYPIQGRETVLDGILAAGGLNSKSSRKNIILVRPSLPEGCRTVLAVCYPEIVQLGDTSTNYQLQPGDRIYVSSKCFFEGVFHKEPCVTCTGPQRSCDFTGGACAAPAATQTQIGSAAVPNPMPTQLPR